MDMKGDDCFKGTVITRGRRFQHARKNAVLFERLLCSCCPVCELISNKVCRYGHFYFIYSTFKIVFKKYNRTTQLDYKNTNKYVHYIHIKVNGQSLLWYTMHIESTHHSTHHWPFISQKTHDTSYGLLMMDSSLCFSF